VCLDLLSDLLEDVLAAVVDRFEACGAPGFCRAGLVGGNVSWDDCCECGPGEGQLWVRLIEWIPDPDVERVGPVAGCDQPGVAMVGVGALRCVPVLNENGSPPSAEEEALAARKIHLDAQLIRSGVLCGIEEREWIGWAPLGYEGGCGGGEHIFSIPFSGCDCDEPTSPAESP
jgi:hypothetical protein